MEIKVYRCYNRSNADPHFVVVTFYDHNKETFFRYKKFDSKDKDVYMGYVLDEIVLGKSRIWKRIC